MIATVLACCLVLPASVDTLYVVDFSTQPPDWIPGPLWQWLTDCAYLDIWCYGPYYGYGSEEDSLISPAIVVSGPSDSLVVVFDHLYYTHGINHAPGEWSKSTMSLSVLNSSASTPELLWELIHSDGRGFSSADSGFVYSTLLGAAPGDTLTFTFKGLVEAYTLYMYAEASLDWELYSFCVLSYSEEHLQPATWAAIKSAF